VHGNGDDLPRPPALQGATHLTDVPRVHIDGCIYGGARELGFAEKMARWGAKTRVPTTMNAISVDHANWARAERRPPALACPPSAFADAYLKWAHGRAFTCGALSGPHDAPTEGRR